jgi:hypothetical protein
MAERRAVSDEQRRPCNDEALEPQLRQRFLQSGEAST